jgi:signal transduction histidine kinase
MDAQTSPALTELTQLAQGATIPNLIRSIEQQLVAAAQDKAVLEERQRLARDLHDSVTQALYGVTLHAEAALRLLAAGDLTTTAAYLRELRDTAQEALDEMRLLLFELRPPVLEQVGLAAALQARLNAVEGRANLETRLSVEDLGKLPSAVEQALYRIVQEALNNALKHAHARRITVHLLRTDTSVILEVNDDGVGFDVAAAQETGGLGLRGIAERAAQFNGKVTVHSAPGAGTQLRVEIGL